MLLTWSPASRQVNQSFHLSYPLNFQCSYGESVFVAADHLAVRCFEVSQGQVLRTFEYVMIGETTYFRQQDDDLWESADIAQLIASHSLFLNSEIWGRSPDGETWTAPEDGDLGGCRVGVRLRRGFACR